MRTHQAYRFALDPTMAQRRMLASHCGAARFAFNWGLARLKAQLDAGGGGRVAWNLYALRREWNASKSTVAPWWPENSKEAYASGLDGLSRALQAWSASRRGVRHGESPGFPRFRARGRRDSCRFTTGAIRAEDERHLTLPRIGRLHTHEATTTLSELLGQRQPASCRRRSAERPTDGSSRSPARSTAK